MAPVRAKWRPTSRLAPNGTRPRQMAPGRTIMARAGPDQPTGADEDHEMEVSLGEGPQILTQPLVGREAEDLVGVLG
jgi:hypothetical protein